MKIRTTLTLKYTVVTAAVLLLCMIIIYLASEYTRSRTFFYNLKSEAITKVHLFLQNETSAETMQSIYLNNRQFINEVEVAVYTTDFKIIYHDAIQSDIIKEDYEMIRDILTQKEIEFNIGKYQGLGLLYHFNGKDYIVTATAYDGYGYNNLNNLQNTLIILFIIGLTLLFLAGYYLARSSLKPIRDIVRETEMITGSRMEKRLPVKNEKDELGELSTAFNALLDRLEFVFKSQKMFISNVSHELKTPLAALIAELDLTLQKQRSSDRYKTAIQNSLDDARRMTKLIDGLLNFAKADYDKNRIAMQEIRLDELLLDVRKVLLKVHPDYTINLLFEQMTEEDDDRMITVNANLYLINIAFSNIIENNCKYSSDHSSFIQISHSGKWTVIRFSDDGIGMNETDKENLFTLFYRGEQNKDIDGHGIGMALTQKIITLHQGDISVYSKINEGTSFIIKLPHI